MSDRLGRMPFPPEVNSFEAEVGGYQQFVCGGWTENGAIVTDPGD